MPEGQSDEQMFLTWDFRILPGWCWQADLGRLQFLYGQAPFTPYMAYPLFLLFHNHVIPKKKGRQRKVYLTSWGRNSWNQGTIFPRGCCRTLEGYLKFRAKRMLEFCREDIRVVEHVLDQSWPDYNWFRERYERRIKKFPKNRNLRTLLDSIKLWS